MTPDMLITLLGTIAIVGAWVSLPARAYWRRRTYRRLILARLGLAGAS